MYMFLKEKSIMEMFIISGLVQLNLFVGVLIYWCLSKPILYNVERQTKLLEEQLVLLKRLAGKPEQEQPAPGFAQLARDFRIKLDEARDGRP